MMGYLPVLEIFLGILGFAFTVLFCTTFCRACSRIRAQERELERESWGHRDTDGRPPSIYFIPFPSVSQHDGDDPFRLPDYSQEASAPPRYSTTVYYEPPPAYNELVCKPEDLPPPYTDYNMAFYPVPASDSVPSYAVAPDPPSGSALAPWTSSTTALPPGE